MRLVLLISRFTPTCPEVARILSLGMEQELSFWTRLKLRVHYLMCSFCERYAKQLKYMRTVSREFPYQLAITIGILVSYLTGLLVSGDGVWRTMFGLGAVPGLLFFAGLVFLPGIAALAHVKGYPDEARASLRRLRDEGWNVEGELDEMVRTRSSRDRPQTGYWALLDPAIRPALIVAVGLFFLQQLSGINAVIYYAPEIFSHAGFDSANTQVLATVGVGTVNLLTTVLAMFLIDRLGRRRLLIVGFAGTSATMLVIALAVINPTLVPSWVVIVVLLFYIASFAISLGPLPHVMMSEVFPLQGAWTGHEHGIDQQLGLQLHRGLHLPVAARRPGSRLHLHDLRRHLPGRNRLHPGAGAGNHGLSLEAIETHCHSGRPLVTLKPQIVAGAAVAAGGTSSAR